MAFVRALTLGLLFGTVTLTGRAQTEIGATRVTANLEAGVDRPLRYRPVGGDFVIENGTEFFNRPLYGGNTAFRVDGGDRPEFVLYLPGRGGNLRLGIRTPRGGKWLHDAAHVEFRYRPGELRYVVRDPLLGGDGELQLVVLALAETEGVMVRAEATTLPSVVELLWAYGGVNGQRGKRDGDIGTESVPISQWFQLRPEFCRGNTIELGADGFTLRAKSATLVGVAPEGARQGIGDAANWRDAAALFASLTDEHRAAPAEPVVTGRVTLTPHTPVYLSVQRVDPTGAGATDLATYQEVTAPGAADGRVAAQPRLPAFRRAELPQRFATAQRHFEQLRQRVTADTPDEFLNAAVAALNVAADALWDEPQQAIMHGAIAWRTKLLGWRGPYALDALGWHDRARRNAMYWFGRQNTAPIPATIPPPDEKANLARNEAGLHTNGDLSNSHYDMNLVFIDAVFRHLQWTGDLAFARQAWPVIVRHLAWERRLFRREYGPDRLPLYEACAAIWASDDLQYSGGGTMHASAYNYYENRQAARLARLLGEDPGPYEREADLLARSVRELLWVSADEHDRAATGAALAAGWFAEAKDWLGAQRVHPSAALWTFYHTIDSEVPTPFEAWRMAERVDADLPHIPVRGPGVPTGLWTLGTSRWMPYDWSINNVVMGEAVHGALALWQAGRPDEAWAVTKGSVLAAMFMGISPGNVGSMSYLDVYRRESQRDFGDGAGVLSRALIEGLFGVKPDLLAGEVRLTPGWPAAWEHAELRHPDFDLHFQRNGHDDAYTFKSRFARPVSLQLRVVARGDHIARVAVNGASVAWQRVESSIDMPRVEIIVPAPREANIPLNVTISWAGEAIRPSPAHTATGVFESVTQGEMQWRRAPAPERKLDAALSGLAPLRIEGAMYDPVNLAPVFNDRVTQIFRNEYRSPRSPFVSLALPKQGIGGWAGGMNRTALIDDSGLRSAAERNGGRIVLPSGVPLLTPAPANAPNVVFTSQWDNYPRRVVVPLQGHARGVYLLLAGSTGPMQSRFENGTLVLTYTDGSTTTVSLVNPTNWWPIEQDYFVDDYQFRRPEPLPIRVDLKTGQIRQLEAATFKGRGATISGGAATVLAVPLEPGKELQSLSVAATANDVVVGLMAATLAR